MDRDKDNIFKFAALQSESGQKLLQKFKLNSSEFDTFILVDDDKYFTKSTAALMISKKLSSIIRLLYPLIILPELIRDFIYELIAKNRYKFFGKRDICRIPNENEKLKFLV
jgi:predicted DCC family thiol-disulfide oxidoreductase YuxK